MISIVMLPDMKKLLFPIGLLLIFQIHSNGQVKKFSDLLGKWDIVGEQNTGGALEIIDSATIFLTYQGERKKIEGYKIDFSKSPYWFDFSTRDTSSTIQIKSLLQPINEGMLKWQLFVDEDRVDHFSSSKGILYYL